MAFDGITDVAGNMWHSSNVKSWIQFDFGEEFLVRGIRMYPDFKNKNYDYTRSIPKVFNILGSNDGANYTILFQSTDRSGYTPGVDQYVECMFLDNLTKYRYYKIDCDINYEGTYYACIADIQFYLKANI